jgi:hypothetical protein
VGEQLAIPLHDRRPAPAAHGGPRTGPARSVDNGSVPGILPGVGWSEGREGPVEPTVRGSVVITPAGRTNLHE